jgi:CHRD domain
MLILKRRARLMLAGLLTSAAIGAGVLLAAGAPTSASAETSAIRLSANLSGFQEVPSVNTQGRGVLRATMTRDQIRFRLTYANLSAPPLVAHIHVGQPGVNGGVAVFFCGGGGKPACPPNSSGSVSGTITAADVVGPTAQGFTAGDLASLERAIRAGVTYANMHTSNFPNGEIRGQIRPGEKRFG